MTSPTIEDLRRAVASPTEFRRLLLVDAGAEDGELKSFDSVLDDWQRKDFEAFEPAWRRIVGQKVEGDPVRLGYLERPRGHSKTTDLAVMVAWALFASRKDHRISGTATAADREQARLLRGAIQGLVYRNDWLAPWMETQRDRVINPVTGSELAITASDAPSAYGTTPDFMVADELTHWTSQDTWSAIFSAVPKKKNCVLVIISNAGVGKNSAWQWRVRELARTSLRWYFSRLDGPRATWQDPADLDEQRLVLPTNAYKRLWLNEWVEESGDALEAEDIRAAVREELGSLQEAEEGWWYAAGLDLGAKHDHSAVVVLGCRGDGRVRVASVKSWVPLGGKVDLMQVEADVLKMDELFGFQFVSFDPSQALLMAQRLESHGVAMVETPFSGPNCAAMARDLLGVFRSRQIDLYPNDRLRDDLMRLSIVERRYGFKLEAISDERGHADTAYALAIGLTRVLPYADIPLLADEPSMPDRLTT